MQWRCGRKAWVRLNAASRLVLFGGVEDKDGGDGVQGFGGELDSEGSTGVS